MFSTQQTRALASLVVLLLSIRSSHANGIPRGLPEALVRYSMTGSGGASKPNDAAQPNFQAQGLKRAPSFFGPWVGGQNSQINAKYNDEPVPPEWLENLSINQAQQFGAGGAGGAGDMKAKFNDDFFANGGSNGLPPNFFGRLSLDQPQEAGANGQGNGQFNAESFNHIPPEWFDTHPLNQAQQAGDNGQNNG